MCKISFGSVITEDILTNLTEPAEEGAGIVALMGGRIHTSVNHDGTVVRDFIRKNLLNQTEFYLYHSRLPSVGLVTDYNTQPFYDDERYIAFGHNGTIDPIEFLPYAIATGVDPNPLWSDSKLLFEILRRVGPGVRQMLLQALPGNFVWVDLLHGKLEMYGTWRRQFDAVRTKYGEDHMFEEFVIPFHEGTLDVIPLWKDSGWPTWRQKKTKTPPKKVLGIDPAPVPEHGRSIADGALAEVYNDSPVDYATALKEGGTRSNVKDTSDVSPAPVLPPNGPDFSTHTNSMGPGAPTSNASGPKCGPG